MAVEWMMTYFGTFLTLALMVAECCILYDVGILHAEFCDDLSGAFAWAMIFQPRIPLSASPQTAIE